MESKYSFRFSSRSSGFGGGNNLDGARGYSGLLLALNKSSLFFCFCIGYSLVLISSASSFCSFPLNVLS